MPGKVEKAATLTPEQQYKAAKEYASQLEIDNSLGRDRNNWLTGVRSFRKIHLAERKGPIGPPSLYMTAKMYRRMFAQFKVPLDLETALNSFLELADLYPGSTLADDALYEAAECASLIKGREQEAAEFYRKIVTSYPQGDQYEKAKVKVQKQEKSQPSVSVDTAVPAPKNLARLSPVKHWSSTKYSRVVIQTTAPVSFTAGLLDKSENQPRRLYVDISKSYMPPDFRTLVPIKNGLLQNIRTVQHDEDNLRLILDLRSLSEYQIFSLSDPFRVIVDIHGGVTDSRRAQPPENSPASMSETVPAPLQRIATATTSIEKGEQAVINLTDQKKRSPQIEPTSISKSTIHEKLSLAQQLGLGVRTIVIDPGHGGKDPGAIAFGVKEKDVVLKISKKVAKILKETYGYEVVLTRSKDIYIPLEERTAIANTHKSDLFISIHINAHSDQTKGGIETYFLNLATDANAMRVAARENATSTHSIGELQDILDTLMKNSKIDESSRLARFVQTNLVSGLGHKFRPRDLGVKQAPFYVLIGAEMPAILAEISFLTNPEEAKLLQNEQYLDKVAEQLAKGIVAYVDHHHTAAVKL